MRAVVQLPRRARRHCLCCGIRQKSAFASCFRPAVFRSWEGGWFEPAAYPTVALCRDHGWGAEYALVAIEPGANAQTIAGLVGWPHLTAGDGAPTVAVRALEPHASRHQCGTRG